MGILIVWIVFSGVGGLGLQTSDYLKHNALSYDLIVNPYPIKYIINDKVYYLSHYLGYYLTPAFFGKFLGWTAYNYINIVWTSLGISLSVFWVARLTGKLKWYVLLLFILFGGLRFGGGLVQYSLNGTLDIFYKAVYGTVSLFSLNSLTHSFEFIYHNTTDLIYWSPQHTIGAWIGVGLFLEDWHNRKNIRYAPLYFSALAFWSPWTFIGLCPFALVAVIQLKDYHKWFSISSFLAGLTILGLTVVFLFGVTNNHLINHFIFNNYHLSGASNLTIFKSYLFFICSEVLIYAIPILIVMYLKKDTHFFLVILTTVVLLLVPLYRYGQWNDWCAKVGVPAQFILTIMVIKMILQKTKLSYYLIGIFLICAIIPIITIINSFRYARHYPIPNFPKEVQIASLPETANTCACWPKEQFIASEESFFFKYISR